MKNYSSTSVLFGALFCISLLISCKKDILDFNIRVRPTQSTFPQRGIPGFNLNWRGTATDTQNTGNGLPMQDSKKIKKGHNRIKDNIKESLLN